MAPCGGVEGVGVDSGDAVDVVDVHEGDVDVGGDGASRSSWWKEGVQAFWAFPLPTSRKLLPPLPIRKENRETENR